MNGLLIKKQKNIWSYFYWDVSNITNMSYLFSRKKYLSIYSNQSFNKNSEFDEDEINDYTLSFNEDLSLWDVSNVTNMEGMFAGCQSFNKPLNDWKVSNVRNMTNMFNFCVNFNQPLNNWNTSNVITMNCMFCTSIKFNQPLNNWNVSNVITFEEMFQNCRNFNQPLNN